MQSDPTPAEIAARLSPAQQEAVMSVSRTHYRPLKPKHSKAMGADLRWRLCLRSGADYTLSDLGLRVRAALEQEGRGDE